MSVAVDHFCDKLRDRLNDIEGRFESSKADMRSLSDEAETAIRGKLEEARSKIERQKKKIEKTRANLKAMAQQKHAETNDAVKEWKTNRETQKLKARADRAEAYAAETIDHAVASIDEVQEAMLYAAVARLDAHAAR